MPDQSTIPPLIQYMETLRSLRGLLGQVMSETDSVSKGCHLLGVRLNIEESQTTPLTEKCTLPGCQGTHDAKTLLRAYSMLNASERISLPTALHQAFLSTKTMLP